MQALTEWLSSPLALLGCIVALLLALVLPLYALLAKQRRATRHLLKAMERLLDGRLAALQDTTVQARMADREALGHSLRGSNDSVTQVLGEMSRVQQQQLDSFSGQLRASSAAEGERQERMRQQLDERLAANERRMADIRQTLEAGMQRLQGENDKKLEQIRVTVDEKLNTTLDKRLGESFRTVSERLEQVYKGLGEMQSLAVGVGDLKKVLTGVKTRGIWGEVQLGALLEQALAPSQYATNVAVKPASAERVEYAVLLPGRGMDDAPVYLPIDAKFPAEDYQRLLEAADGGDRQAVDAASRALEATIRAEAKRIHDKYIAPPYTTDFAIMFLPVEGLYAEALRRGGIIEQLQGTYRIVVTGPTTLLALLNSLQMGFRTVAIEKRSSEVWALLGAVKAEFGKFADLLVKTQQKLRQASDSIDIAARKTRTIERRLKSVQLLTEDEAGGLLDLEDEAEQLAFGATEASDDDLPNPEA